MAILESVKLLINSGMIVSREIKLNASVMKVMSIRLTEKFQRRFRWTKSSVFASNSAAPAGDLQRVRRRFGQVIGQRYSQVAANLPPGQIAALAQ